MALQLPQEFENDLKPRLGGEWPAFCKALEESSPTSIRYNPDKVSEPIKDQVPWSKYGGYLAHRPVFTLDPRLHAGGYYVQEASSMFLEQAILQSVDVSQSLNVLDLCAAPGGKSTHILSLISKESLLISNEAIRSRASVLSENIQKWGHDNVIVTQSDPATFQRLPSFFDLIVVDAPCSGEGLFRKDPEAMKEWSEKNVDLCSLRQRRILEDVWPSLKAGGILIYSTCTYSEKENLENLQWLQSENEVEFIPLKYSPEWAIEKVEKGTCIGYQFYPHRVKGEGFFLAVMRKQRAATGQSSRSRDTLETPSQSQVKEFSGWILAPDSKSFFLHHETVRMLPSSKRNDLLLALNNLNVFTAGTAVLEITRNKFIPDHALALSLNVRKENFNRISTSKEQALDYLSKNSISLPSTDLGFALIEFEGLGLGWVNVLQNRINNLYPADWRIRMDHRK